MINLFILTTALIVTDKERMWNLIPQPDPAMKISIESIAFRVPIDENDCGSCQTNSPIVYAPLNKVLTFTWNQKGTNTGWVIEESPTPNGPWYYTVNLWARDNTNEVKMYKTFATNGVRFYRVSSY